MKSFVKLFKCCGHAQDFVRTIFFTLIFISFSWTTSNAQDVRITKEFKVEVSSPYRVIDAYEKHYFNENGILLTVKLARKKFYIQKIDLQNLKEVSMREVLDMPEHYLFEGLIQVPGKVLFFYSLWDKPNLTEQLYVREIDFETGTISEKPNLLIAVEGKLAGAQPDWTDLRLRDRHNKPKIPMYVGVVDKFSFETSFDSAKIVVRYRKKPETRDDSKSFDVIGMNVYTYENGLKHLWGKEFTMPYTEHKMDELGFTIDSEGNTYLLARVYEGDKRRVKDKDGLVLYTVEVFKVNAQTQNLSQIKVDLPQRHINEITLFETADNNLTLTGYYSIGSKKEKGVDGSFIAKLSKNNEVTEMSSFEIPLEILNQNVKKREAAKNIRKEGKDDGKGAQLENLVYRSAKRYSDGSILLIGEQHYIERNEYTKTGSSGAIQGTGRYSYEYYYEDILVTKISANGQIAWINRLPKNQYGPKDKGGMSFKHIESENNHYFLYLDNIKNVNLADNKEPAKHLDGKGGFLTAYKVNDNTGDVSKLYIFDTKKVNGNTEVFQFAPSRIFKSTETDFFLEVYKKSKEDILIKMTLDEGVQ